MPSCVSVIAVQGMQAALDSSAIASSSRSWTEPHHCTSPHRMVSDHARVCLCVSLCVSVSVVTTDDTGHLECVKQLVGKGCVNAATLAGAFPLFVAAQNGTGFHTHRRVRTAAEGELSTPHQHRGVTQVMRSV